MDELREAGVEVLFVTVPSPTNAEDKILHGVKGLFAEYERAKITERFGLENQEGKGGHVLTTEAPYGIPMCPKRIHNTLLRNQRGGSTRGTTDVQLGCK